MSDTHLDIQIQHVLHTAQGTVSMEVELKVPQGAMMGLTGPSGAGKTTLLRILAGLVKPRSGRITFGESVWMDTRTGIFQTPQQRQTGLVFQDYALFPHLTVRQNVAFGLEKGEDPLRVDELLREVELSQLADQKPHQLSGGQQQRVALARALVRRPRLLLLDEPLSALDRSMRHRLQEFLLMLHQRYQLTILLVTHDLAEIVRLTDQVVKLDGGKVVRQGSPGEVFAEAGSTSEGPALLGEVLACRIEGNYLLVQALIDQRIHKFRLAASRASDLRPGSTFLLRYSVDSPIVEVIH